LSNLTIPLKITPDCGHIDPAPTSYRYSRRSLIFAHRASIGLRNLIVARLLPAPPEDSVI